MTRYPPREGLGDFNNMPVLPRYVTDECPRVERIADRSCYFEKHFHGVNCSWVLNRRKKRQTRRAYIALTWEQIGVRQSKPDHPVAHSHTSGNVQLPPLAHTYRPSVTLWYSASATFGVTEGPRGKRVLFLIWPWQTERHTILHSLCYYEIESAEGTKIL